MLKQLSRQNQWWDNKKSIELDVNLRELKLKRYTYSHPFLKKFRSVDGIFVLKGPRQIGKSTLLKQLIRSLLISQKIKSSQVFYYACDTVLNFRELYEILLYYIENVSRANGRRYILLDEVTYVDEWQRAVKQLVDEGLLMDTTVVITGSNLSSLTNSSELLPGRRGKHLLEDLDIDYLPLGVKEYAQLTKQGEILKAYDQYILVGGFPNVINEYMTKGYVSDVTYEVYLQWLMGDVNRLKRDTKMFFRICEYLFRSTCTPLSIYNIAKSVGSPSNDSIATYVEILQKLFVIKKVSSYSIEQKKFDLVKNEKYYFIDPFIAWTCYLRGIGVSDNYFANSQRMLKENASLQSKLMQSVVGIEMMSRYDEVGYYRNKEKKEVDFVGVKDARIKEIVEVKLGSSGEEKNYRWFEEDFPELKLKLVGRDELAGWYK